MSKHDRPRNWLTVFYSVVLAIFAIVLVFAFATQGDEPAAQNNGDTLGQETGETFTEYEARAEQSLSAAPATEAAFGLVTFAEPLDADEAAEALSDIERISAITLGPIAPHDVPEPVDGEDRSDVFSRELERLGLPEEISGVVVYDTGESLRKLARDPAVATVEVLPPDAVWGTFGTRSVEVPSGSSAASGVAWAW